MIPWPLTSPETKEPPFLQKLRGQYGGTAAGRLERPMARPRRPKDNDDDDEPTYVDEESNEVISKEEYNALVHGSNQKEEATAVQAPEPDKQASKTDSDEEKADKQPPTSKQNLAEIGGPKKRKQAKIVGEDSVPEEEESKGNDNKSKPKKKSEKKKKIKLSFDDQ